MAFWQRIGQRRGFSAGRAPDDAVFRRARLRLTAWYAAIVVVIVVGFSAALYGALASVLVGHQSDGPDPQPEQVTERQVTDFTLARLRLLLVVGNVILLAGVAGGAYLLAGKTLRPVREAMARQRRFAADASHELRTPLTVMRGTLDVALQRERSPDAYRAVLRDVGDEVDTMSGLTEQLLRLARGGLPSAALNEPCNLRAVLDEVMHGTAELAAERGDIVTLAASASLAAPLMIRGDCAALRQVFLNLVQNALLHTAAGTPVYIEPVRHRDVIEVTVSDRGPGIPQDERERVFEPFYRSRTAVAEGSGLGLALAREVVRAHGGTITICETAGGGTAVRVRLPIRGQP